MTQDTEMLHLLNLNLVTQVTMPRAGSEYLQSLYDGNDDVLIFPTNFRFFSEYLNSSITINSDHKFAEDIVFEFVSKEFHRLKSKYFKSENLNKLGKEGKDFINIPILDFVNNFKDLIKDFDLNVRNIFLAIYGSFHKSIGRNILDLKIIWHHAHYYKEALEFKKNFPNSKIIINIRNPLAIFYSIQKSYKLNNFSAYRYDMLESTILSIDNLSSKSAYKKIKDNFKDILYVRLEDLPRKSEIIKISKFLGVAISKNNFISTWAGYEWYGDRVSARTYKPDEVWTEKRSYNGWDEGLSSREKYIIKSLFGVMMKKYSYLQNVENKNNLPDFIKYIFYSLFPLRTEIDFFSIEYYRKKMNQHSKKYSLFIIIGYFIYEFLYLFKFRYFLIKFFLKNS